MWQFCKNFIPIRLKWVNLRLLLVSAGFSPNSSKLPDLDETIAGQVFKVAINKPAAVIELRPFLGTLDPILTQNWAYLKYSWPYGLGDLAIVFLVEFHFKIRHFCKKFEKSPKMVKSALTTSKGKFFCDFIEVAQFNEAASTGVFKVAEFESVMIIEIGPYLVR